MRLDRTLPPAAAPLRWIDLLNGIRGLFRGERQRTELERDLKQYFGVKHAFCVNSGKTALTLILLALQELSPRKEVVLPAYTCFSVPSAVLRAGLRPKLCDVDAKTFDFNFDHLQQVMSPDTLCVLPGHLFGIAADLDRLQALCRPKGVMIVEDAAQAMGGMQNNRFLGTLGDAGFFSLGRGKAITCGEGGIVVTNSDAIGQAISHHYTALIIFNFKHILLDLIKTFLMMLLIRPRLYWIPASIPMLKLGQTFFYKDFPMARLSGANAGLLTRWRDRLNRSLCGREEVAKYFQQEMRLPEPSARPRPYLRLPILMKDRNERDTLFAHSQRQGAGLSLMYPGTLNDIDEIRDSNLRFPGAQSIADRLIALPTHEYVSSRDLGVISALVGCRLNQPRTELFRDVRT